MVKKPSGRVYLSDEEKKVLAGNLQEWNGNPSKKSRNAFISAEVLPKIQASIEPFQIQLRNTFKG
jgi:hypothetical protein